MHDSQRYRDNAAECLLAAQEASDPNSRRLHPAPMAKIVGLHALPPAVRAQVSA